MIGCAFENLSPRANEPGYERSMRRLPHLIVQYLRKQQPSITLDRIRWAIVWLGAAGVALGWITGSEALPVTIWWVVLGIAIGGIIASLSGFAGVYNLLVVILMCAALVTMQYWIYLLIPSR
jgi:hypothetical protein